MPFEEGTFGGTGDLFGGYMPSTGGGGGGGFNWGNIGSFLQDNPETLGFGLDALANILDPEGTPARAQNPLSGTKLAQSSLAGKAEKARGEKYGKHLGILEELFKVLSGDEGLQSVGRKKTDSGDLYTLTMAGLGENVRTPAEAERQFQPGA